MGSQARWGTECCLGSLDSTGRGPVGQSRKAWGSATWAGTRCGSSRAQSPVLTQALCGPLAALPGQVLNIVQGDGPLYWLAIESGFKHDLVGRERL